jgi:hypothetical protein
LDGESNSGVGMKGGTYERVARDDDDRVDVGWTDF